LGWEVVFEEVFPPETEDFSTLLTQMDAASPDLLVVPGHSADCAKIVGQMRDLRIDVNAIAHAITLEDMRDALGADADYLTVSQFWSTEVQSEGDFFGSAQDFNELYREKYGEDAYSVPAQAAAAGVIFWEAVRKADSLDPRAIEEALDSLDIETFFGPVRYSDLGINEGAQTQILQLQEGEVKLVWPPELAPEGNEPIYPMPTWEERLE
jgi:branched-chain amino acid transport system substrate-binding protein